MNQRQAVAYIGAYLWKRERFGMLFTLIFAIYLGFVGSGTIDGMLGEEAIPKVLNGILDWMNLAMFPVFGMVMNKSSWGMWRDDYYSKRLAQLRTMPIPASAIVRARMLQSAVMLPIVGGAYLLIPYLISSNLRAYATPLQWIENGILWFMYALIMLAVIIWFELGFTGKQYCLFYFSSMIFVGITAAILTWQEIYVFREVLNAVKNGYGWALMLGMAVLAAAAIAIGQKLTTRRIRARSLSL